MNRRGTIASSRDVRGRLRVPGTSIKLPFYERGDDSEDGTLARTAAVFQIFKQDPRHLDAAQRSAGNLHAIGGPPPAAEALLARTCREPDVEGGLAARVYHTHAEHASTPAEHALSGSVSLPVGGVCSVGECYNVVLPKGYAAPLRR